MDPSRRPTPDDPDQLIRELRSLVSCPVYPELEAPAGAANVADLDQDVLQPSTNADIHRPENMAPLSFAFWPQGLDDQSSSTEGRPSNQQGIEQTIEPFLNLSAPPSTSASTSEPPPVPSAPAKDRNSEHATNLPNVHDCEFEENLAQKILQSYQHSELPSFQMDPSPHTECLDGSPEASESFGHAPGSPQPFEDSRQYLPSPASASSPYSASSMTSSTTMDTQRLFHLPMSPLRYPHSSFPNSDEQSSQPRIDSSNQTLLPPRSITSYFSSSSFRPIPPIPDDNNTRRPSHHHRPLSGASSSTSQMYPPNVNESSFHTSYSTHPSSSTSSPYRTIVPSTRQRNKPKPPHLPSSSTYASSSRTQNQAYGNPYPPITSYNSATSSHPQYPQVVHIEPFEGSLPHKPERANFEHLLNRFRSSPSQPLGKVKGKPRSQRPNPPSSASISHLQAPPKIERRGAISGPITPPTSRTGEAPSESSSYHRRAPDKKRKRPSSDEERPNDSKRQKTIVKPKQVERKKRNVACLSCRKKKKRCDKRPGSMRCVCCENEGNEKICQYTWRS